MVGLTYFMLALGVMAIFRGLQIGNYHMVTSGNVWLVGSLVIAGISILHP